jgi:hypothetical protein
MQTILTVNGGQAGLQVRHRNLTFVAFPHLSKTKDLTFSEENFWQAPAHGHLFIRKRPATLMPGVLDRLEGFAAFSCETLRGRLATISAEAPPFRRTLDANWLAERLQATLRSEFPALRIQNLAAKGGTGPHCYLRFQFPRLPHPFAVCLLSEDLKTFKVALTFSHPFNGDYAPMPVGSRTADVIKARLHGLFQQREIRLGKELDHGFVVVRGGHDVDRVAQILLRAMLIGTNLKG